MIVGPYKVLQDKKPDNSVWLDCVDMLTGDVCQCYRMYKDEFESTALLDVLLKCVRTAHQNVAKLIDFLYVPKSGNIYVFFEELLIGFNEVQGVSETEGSVKLCFQQACFGLRHLHRMGIAHRCLVIGNVCVTADGGIKLRGFLGDHASTTRLRCAGYRPPELKSGAECDWFAVDIWCLGACLFWMLHGRTPWKARESMGEFEFKDGLSAEVVSLIKWMMSEDPKERPSIDEVLQSKWVDGDANEKVPEDRCDLGLEQLIQSFFDHH